MLKQFFFVARFSTLVNQSGVAHVSSERRKLLKVNVLTPQHVGIVTAFCVLHLSKNRIDHICVVPETLTVNTERNTTSVFQVQRLVKKPFSVRLHQTPATTLPCHYNSTAVHYVNEVISGEEVWGWRSRSRERAEEASVTVRERWGNTRLPSKTEGSLDQRKRDEKVSTWQLIIARSCRADVLSPLLSSPPSSLLWSFPFLSPLQQAFLHLHPPEKSPVSSFHNSLSPDSNIAYSVSSFTHPPSTSQHLYNAIATEKCLRNSTFNLQYLPTM